MTPVENKQYNKFWRDILREASKIHDKTFHLYGQAKKSLMVFWMLKQVEKPPKKQFSKN